MNEGLRDVLLFPKRMSDAILRGLGRMVVDHLHALGIEIPSPQEAQAQWDAICEAEFGHTVPDIEYEPSPNVISDGQTGFDMEGNYHCHE